MNHVHVGLFLNFLSCSVFLSVFVLIPHVTNTALQGVFKSGGVNNPVLFIFILPFLHNFHFHIHFRMSSSVSTKKPAWILIICIECVNKFREN